MDQIDLKIWRTRHGLNQSEAASLIGAASYGTWQSWELGKRRVPAYLKSILRYRTLCHDELARLALTRNEAGAVVAALSGWLVTDDDYTHLWMSVEDYLHGDEAGQWNLDNPAVLVAKLRTLGPGGCWAVIDAVERMDGGLSLY